MSFKEIIKDFSNWSGVNVVTQAYYSRNKKILFLWILFMISMLTLTILLIMQKIFVKKIETKVLTTRRVNEDFFPKISVCFNIHNKYDEDSIFDSDPEFKNEFYGKKFSTEMKTNSFHDPEMYINNLQRNFRISYKKSLTGQDDLTKISVIECTYLGQNCNKFMTIINYDEHGIGRCFLFENKKQKFGAFSRVGKEFGLSVLLKNEISDIKNHFRKAYGYPPYLSIQYQILNPKDKENHLLTTFHTDVLPLGYEVNIPITITKEIKNKNISNCLDYNTEVPDSLHESGAYTYESCYTNCLKKNQLAQCTSVMPMNPNMSICGKVKPCTCNDLNCFNCLSDSLFPNNLNNGNLHPEFKDKCSCPPPCESYTYKTNPNYSKLHAKNMAAMLGLTGSEEDLEDDISANYVILNFFIKEHAVLTKKEEIVYRSANLFADIGNSLSLLLGLGMINIIEIFFCLFLIIIDRIRYFIKFRRLY
uniref:Acid-sensing ion channel 5 n=1 Tax=Strongyloides papillosus TaxID=174720 RepID=A0A0N5C1C3_STREA